ncbi:hypothetical protein BDR07DRAFT_1373961 [Suillus spraguei]|nr:hypothetical protein BDR07DRAFT_1373961 [Suillus spraguei]
MSLITHAATVGSLPTNGTKVLVDMWLDSHPEIPDQSVAPPRPAPRFTSIKVKCLYLANKVKLLFGISINLKERWNNLQQNHPELATAAIVHPTGIVLDTLDTAGPLGKTPQCHPPDHTEPTSPYASEPEDT